MTLPLVAPDDNGIRPAGKSDECFYCQQKVGTPHGNECVAVHKTVKVKYSYYIEIEVPYFWSKENIESHRNESSWCADNSFNDLKEFLDKKGEEGGCACDFFDCEYIGKADPTPYIKHHKG